MYDKRVLTSKEYTFPVLCVGNLSVGGTGKTPMIEYLIRLLQQQLRLATLSRGYKRKTTGFVLANSHTTVTDIGDEPYQYFKKFKKIKVAVDENRRRGIANLLHLKAQPQIILLDDAFQHRKVKAGFNIVLTVYNDLYVDDYMLPTGNLRDNRREAKRADLIVVTKCPHHLAVEEKEEIIKKLRVSPEQYVFFTGISYADQCFSEGRHFSLNELQNLSLIHI